jgi:Dolichyl-phosphate-mannose-protein mannosyltransferase
LIERRSAIRWLLIAVFVGSLIWAISTARIGWYHTLSDLYGFRQTQTAITSYYMMRGGPFFKYETPVLGYPWSIPLEFPLYQWIVALIAEYLHTPLDQTGRFVSELFFYLSLLAVWGILSELGVRRLYRLVFLTLMLVSPEYVFYSRTFMIESTALCFCLTYLYFFLRYTRTRRAVDVVLGTLFGILGALVKITTFPSFALVAGLYYLWRIVRQRPLVRDSKILLAHVVTFLAFFCLPILVARQWTHYTDQIKALNTIGTRLTSSALVQWNFGTLQQRFMASTWRTFFFRIVPDLLGSNVIGLFPLVWLYFTRRRLVPFVICLCGFLSSFLVFIPLHVFHSYYTYANGLFLIAAVSWCIVGLLEKQKWHSLLGAALFFISVTNAVGGYYGRLLRFQIHGQEKSEFSRMQKTNWLHFAGVSSAAMRLTEPQEVLLCFGWEWTSELPYYAQRRAVMWPSWMGEESFDNPALQETIRKLGDNRVGALIVCNESKTDALLIQRTTAGLGLVDRPAYEDESCAIYPTPGNARR